MREQAKAAREAEAAAADRAARAKEARERGDHNTKLRRPDTKFEFAANKCETPPRERDLGGSYVSSRVFRDEIWCNHRCTRGPNTREYPGSFFSNFPRYPMATGTRQVPVINLGAGCTVPFFLDADAFKGM